MKKILILVRDSPYGGIRAREALDAALLFSAFAPEIAVLFSGDGVWQLVRDQRPDAIAAKSVEATLGAFEAYDITRVHADRASLAERGIPADNLPAGATALDAEAIRDLFRQHDRVVTL